MQHSPDQPVAAPRVAAHRLAGAPISWGACEVPGWGRMPDPETVLTEMASLGLRGTELGPPGFLPDDPAELATLLRRHGLRFVGGFTPLVLHEPELDVAAARRSIALLADGGAEVLVAAAVQDPAWSPPRPLTDDGWHNLAAHAAAVQRLAGEYGLTFALHPHVGTLIETDDQVQRALAMTDVGWCLDTGHLMIGGTDPAAFAAQHGDRVTHVHLKDIDAALAAELMAGRLSLLQATQRGLFVPLGQGAAPVKRTLDALDEHGYEGWLVLEQDTAITADEPAVTSASMLAARASIAFLNSAHKTEEINR
ncbi:MAG TPA: TIM barrel protein [Solirubrobacteraceae bacterium]|nr:TIM barrel protein [Solirubrobacteraceae bacterium]